MDVQLFQMILVVLYGFWINYDKNGTMFGLQQPVMAGMVIGFILGDLKTGLFIGGTLQLMTLGISSFGGASVPDYATAAAVGSYIAITTGQEATVGITLAIPVAMLVVQLDVLKWSTNIYFQNKAERYAEQENYRGLELMQVCGVINTSVTSGLPVLLTVIFGPSVIGGIVEYIPGWLSSGLSVAGGLLPAIGIAMLLHYLPARDYFSFLLVGFVLAAYFSMPVLGVALLGTAIALYMYKKKSEAAVPVAVAGGMDEDE